MTVAMTTKIIGVQSIFAIECATRIQSTPLLCPVRVWMNALPLGTLDDETYIPTFSKQLERLVRPENGELEGDGAIISLGDTFDDLIIRRAGSGDRVVATIELVEEPFFLHPLLSKGTTYQCSFPMRDAQAVVSEFSTLVTLT